MIRGFKKVNWFILYLYASGSITWNILGPKFKGVFISFFVGVSHVVNAATRRSHAVFIDFVYHAPVIWYSKIQNKEDPEGFLWVLLCLIMTHNPIGVCGIS